jgi:glycosyltransferase involved in cell wall biosynthesis
MCKHERRTWRRKLIEIESAKMRRYESDVCRRAHLTLAVSETDRAELQQNAPGAKTATIPTGVDTTYFAANGAASADRSLVFTGSLDWFPNEDAILYFLNEMFPAIRAAEPNVTCTFVGRNPTERLKAAADAAGVTLTGTVDDVRPYVRKSAVFIVPLRIGSGTRLKIFEALAMGKAVVSTTVGAEGLGLEDNKHFLQADSPNDFVHAVVSLMRDPARRELLGRTARKLVETHYSWPQVTRHFEARCNEVLGRCTAQL